MSNRLRLLIHLAGALSVASWLPAAAVAQPLRPAVVRDLAAEVACGAIAAATQPEATIRIAGGVTRARVLFGPRDPIVVLAGTAQGVRAGQEYFVRRVIADRFTPTRSDGMRTLSIHTAGWVRIVETSTDAAIATVTHACDAMQEGDYLEPFVLPFVVASAMAAGEPDYAHPGHVILGDDRRQMGAKGDLMVFDRGSDHGLRAGQRLTIFRTTGGGIGPVARIGEAIALVVSSETAVFRIEQTADLIAVGDLVAIHR
jgi:hypothetical protein